MANDARKAGGSLLQARGLATNNPDLFNLGTKLAASPFDAFKPGHGGIMHMAATHGAQGTKIDDSLVSPKEAAEIMSFASNNPGNRDAMNALNGLSKNSILAGAKYMAGQNGIKVNDAKVCQFRGADGKMHSGIKIDGEKAQLNGKGKPILDKDGNAKTHKVSGIISDENAFDSSQKIGDDKMGRDLHCNNSLKKGTTTGTITNASTRESETFNFPSGTSYEDALSSSGARDAIRKVSDSDVVSGFTPTEFGATSASDSGYDETTVSAQFTPNADGSTRATFTNTENGTSTSFDVPDGTSYSDALSSDEAKSAVSSITSGGTAESFSPNEYVMPVTKEDGSRENYSVHFDGKDDGTYDAQITDSRGHSVGSYTSNDDTYGNGIRDAIENDKERCGSYDSISSFAPVEGSPGVYQATATKGETQTVITATDKGMYAESSKNDDPRSFMYVSETDSGTRVAYDVNFGRSYDSTQKNYSNSKTYQVKMEECFTERVMGTFL